MSDKEQRKAPVLRFKGFTDDWEQRKLGDKITRIKSYSISHGYETMHDTNTKYIHYGDIHTGKVKIINDINILPNIKDNNYIGLNKGDIVVADASEDYKGIADACLVNTDTDSNKIVAGLHTIALRPQKDTYPQYLYTYLSTDIFKHFGYKTGTGLKVFGISYKELAKFLVSSPSIKEQKEISKLISLIEKNIDLQQRKLNKLKSLRKGIKESTLPKNLKSPSASFENTGKIFRFSDLFKRSSEKNDGSFSKDKVISVANMRWGTAPKNSSDDYMKTYFILRKGDIAFEGNRSKNYSFGRFVANDLEDGIVSHVFIVYRPKKELNLNYLKYYINDEQVMRTPLRMSTSRTTMMTNLVQKDIVKQKLLLPSIQEQNKLGELYKKVDALIQMNQLKLNRLNQLKQFLLQKLFV